MKSYSDSYKAAGVDVTAGYKSVELMKEHVARTFTNGVLSGIGITVGGIINDFTVFIQFADTVRSAAVATQATEESAVQSIRVSFFISISFLC